MDTRPILKGSHYSGGKLARLLTATGALMGHKLVFLHPELSLRQIEDLPTGYESALSGKPQATLTTMGRLVGMDEIGLLNEVKCFARVSGLATWFFARFFG